MPDQPDFWSAAVVNVLLQDLAEMIIRPKYGTRGVLEFEGAVDPGVTTPLGEIESKGIIYGGAVIVQGAATCGGDSIASRFDGGPQYFTPTFLESIMFGLTGQHGATWQLEKYDDVLWRYAAAVSFGITFESGAEFFYKEVAGRTPYVIVKIMYAVL